jgi:hypothetical protein
MSRLKAIIAAALGFAGYPLKMVDDALTITPRSATKPKRKLTQADRDALAKAEAKRARKAMTGRVAR